VPGSGFNFPARNHFRITLLPQAAQLRDVFARIERVLERHVLPASQRTAALNVA
jgi:alanine-synthesizing transaminase